MSTTAQTARQPILDAIAKRLETSLVGRLDVHRGEMPGAPAMTPAGRVKPYAIVWGGAGRPDPNPSMEPVPSDYLWSGQITFAAGYLDDLMAVLDEAVPLLQLWTPTVPGLSCSPLRSQPGYDPGPARRDDKARPPRFFTPTLWLLHVVTA